MQHNFFAILFGGLRKRSYLCPRLIDFCMIKQQFPAGGCKAAARPSRDEYMCLGHEFTTLRELRAYFRSQGLDYAIDSAGALVYAGDRSIGHLRVVVYYDLFTDPGFAVLVVRDNGKEV